MGLDNTFEHFRGLANTSGNTQSLLPQAIPDKKKGKKWEQGNMDRLESIGLAQLRENLVFRDLYKMVEGRLVYSDYETNPEILRDITKLREQVELPTFVKHYDILGTIVNALVGEYMEQQDRYRVHSTDPISENEFIQEKTERVQKFAQETFEIKLKKKLMQAGLDPDKKDFKSEEEQQQYLQQLEAKRTEMTPPDIELDMQKNWKTKAAEWAENVLEADGERFRMEELDRKEATDFFLTGRYFRHYRVGYDSYSPERWSPINTFFSQDLEIENPQEGEYVGRINYLSASDVINRYGHKLTAAEQQQLTGYYDESTTDGGMSGSSESSFDKILENHFVEQHIIPDKNYYEREAAYALEDMLGQPMGERTLIDEDGNEKTINSWLPKKNGLNYLGNSFASQLRDDINVRTDLLQITESYWRGYQRIGLVTYETNEGIIEQEIVTDELLEAFLKENGIRKVQSVSLETIERAFDKGDLKSHINTIVYTYVPQIYGGTKINKGNSYLKKDLYFVEPLEYQIKGDSDVYDKKLPVSGVIGTSAAMRIRPYQVGYNYCMNQVYNLLEKEIGMFFLFDVNYLPSEFKDQGTSEDWMLMLKDMARDVGVVPVDTSKQNTQSAQQFNTFMSQNITFDAQIKSRLELAQFYKQQALEQLGFNPQRLGNPSQYATAEGVKKSDDASYAQTEGMFSFMRTGKVRTLELHLSVAQYAQKNDKDISLFYTKSTGDTMYLKFTDPNFPLRRLGVLPTANAKSRKQLEQLKAFLMNDNTMNHDINDFAQLMSSESMTEILSVARKARMEAQQRIQRDQQHEQQLLDQKLKAEAAESNAQREWDAAEAEKDRQNRLKTEYMESMGRAADNDASNEDLKFLHEAHQDNINNEQREREIDIKSEQASSNKSKDLANLELQRDKLRLEFEKLKQKQRDNETQLRTSAMNKN
jgi:hypothetical protein